MPNTSDLLQVGRMCRHVTASPAQPNAAHYELGFGEVLGEGDIFSPTAESGPFDRAQSARWFSRRGLSMAISFALA
jgi:hypothetical protein